mmetsp:Transcript_19194/g.27016  ORF Transcript_19194/g.27016 Transcript_19194/m.27016 type:complete len:149 (+) Transcript_19194:157-603(+)
MPVVDGSLVPEKKEEASSSSTPDTQTSGAFDRKTAPTSVPSTRSRGSNSPCISLIMNINLGPKVPFFRFQIPILLLLAALVAIGWYCEWKWKPITLFTLQIVTISVLSITPRRDGYTYNGDQGPAGISSRPRQMGVRDLPPNVRSTGG